MACSECVSNGSVNTCNNPCGTSSVNSAACETLPSQIQNFTTAFFGTVIKAEVDGSVVWTLPCSLETGLPNNPRLPGEGLACYFLRLFLDGILGLTGPPGAPGADGVAGLNAFTVTLASFTQPTLALPNIQIFTAANDAILVGVYVFIQGSGWYLVTANDGAGNLWLTLSRAVGTPLAVIPAGRLVVPAGYPGASVTGLTGPPGPIGATGSPGASYTATNDQVFFSGGTDWTIPVVYANVDVVVGTLQLLLPTAGTYLLTARVGTKGLAAVVVSDVIDFRLRNSTDAVTIDSSYVRESRYAIDEEKTTTISCIYAVAGPRTIKLQGKCTSINAVQATADLCLLHYIRIA